MTTAPRPQDVPAGPPGATEIQQGRLVYDSAAVDRQIGTSYGVSVDRMLLWRAPGLSVDLVVHRGLGPDRVVNGTVVRGLEKPGVERAEISIAKAGDPVKTNEYGEFTLLLEQPEREHVLRVREGTAVTTFTIPDPAAYGED
jgi:hypothetical protein